METSQLHIHKNEVDALAYTHQKEGNNKPAFAYLICERDGEIQHLAIQLPFGLVLHVGDLYFDCHGTLERGKKQEQNMAQVKTEKLTARGEDELRPNQWFDMSFYYS